MYNRPDAPPSEYLEKVVQVNRVSKKTKGGDKRSLSVLVVVGDQKGKVGVGLGKAADVQSAVRKATTYAKKHLIEIPLKDKTIPHTIFIKVGAAKVLLKPAPPGSGVKAGGPVRVVVEAAGIHNVVSKILGTKNRASNVYATLKALSQLRMVDRGQKESRIKNKETLRPDGLQESIEENSEKAPKKVSKKKGKDESK